MDVPLFADLLAALARNRRRSATLRELHRLSPQQLADIGVAPDGLRELADGLLKLSDSTCAKAGRELRCSSRASAGHSCA